MKDSNVRQNVKIYSYDCKTVHFLLKSYFVYLIYLHIQNKDPFIFKLSSSCLKKKIEMFLSLMNYKLQEALN